MFKFLVAALCILVFANCGGDTETVRNASPMSLVGEWRVDPDEALREFLRASDAATSEEDAAQEADPRRGIPVAPEDRAKIRAEAEAWAATYASVFRLLVSSDGSASLTLPDASPSDARARPKVHSGTWEPTEGGFMLGGNPMFGARKWVLVDPHGTRLAHWTVLIPGTARFRRFARRITVSLPLHRV